MRNYRFSPSVLDKFSHLLGAEAEFESDFNYSEDEGYKRSLEEIVAEREKELLDHINKVPHAPIESACKGTAFNEAVDLAVELYKYRGEASLHEAKYYGKNAEGFEFKFRGELVDKVAKRLCETHNIPIMQMHVQATIQTELGNVILHGYPDYFGGNVVTDLKTTTSYTFGKYEGYWQRYVYPYILKTNGMMQEIERFDFLAVELNKKQDEEGILDGNIYCESYTDMNLANCRRELRWICDGFITWLEANRERISNKVIFQEDE